MNFNNLIAAAATRLLGRVVRRMLVVVVMGVCTIVALYHLTIAGNIVLTAQFGDLDARLIIGAVYVAMALISLVIFWAMRGKSVKFSDTPALNSPPNLQFAMLVEAVMLGYALARKDARAR